MSRRKVALVLIGLAVIIPLFVFTIFPIRRELAWIDAVTGSTKHQTAWSFGYTTPPRLEKSALDEWAADRGRTLTYDWRLVAGTSKNIWGRSMGHGHGSAPPIYPLRREWMIRFVNQSSDDDLGAFVATMQSGSESEQEEAVAIASDVAIEALESGG